MLDLKAKIHNDVDLQNFLGDPMPADMLQQFTAEVARILPKEIPFRAILNSSTYLTSTPLTENELHLYAWRLAGNLDTLKEGRQVTPWFRQTELEWVPMQIVDARPTRNSKGTFGCEYTFRVLAGTPCTETIKHFCKASLCHCMAKDLGFANKFKTKNPSLAYRDFKDFVQLRTYGLIDPVRSISSPYFWKMACTPAFRSYNKEIIKKRARVGFECPVAFNHPCSKCPIGYDKCGVGTHPNTYVRLQCHNCKTESWFDLKKSEDLCIVCADKLAAGGMDE